MQGTGKIKNKFRAGTDETMSSGTPSLQDAWYNISSRQGGSKEQHFKPNYFTWFAVLENFSKKGGKVDNQAFRAFRTVLGKALENRLWESLPGYHEEARGGDCWASLLQAWCSISVMLRPLLNPAASNTARASPNFQDCKHSHKQINRSHELYLLYPKTIHHMQPRERTLHSGLQAAHEQTLWHRDMPVARTLSNRSFASI